MYVYVTKVLHLTLSLSLSQGDFKFRNSFSCLVDHLKVGLNVLTQKPVTHVTLSDAAETDSALPRVTIRCEDQSEFRAHAVVMATSLHVLQSKMIEFSPPLEKERDEALHWMIMRPAAKVRLGELACVCVYMCVCVL